MTESPLPDEWFAQPALAPADAERLRRGALAAATPAPIALPEATLAAVFSVLLVAWAVLAVTPGPS